MSRNRSESRTERSADTESRIDDLFDERTDVAMSTRTVADALAIDDSTAEAALERMAERDAIEKVDLEGQHVAWERVRDTYVGQSEDGSYRISDDRSGLVTRADSRTMALRQLADRIDQLEGGNHVGAQIMGIADAVISPEYFDDVTEILESYVQSGTRRVYVYAADEGVTEIETTADLTRERSIRGFTVTCVCDVSEFSDVMLISAERALEATKLEPEHFPVGVFKITAVHPDHQQQGVGTALASHALAYLAETPPVVTMLWERDDGSNARLADNFGAEELGTFDDVTPLDRKCPQCGFETECTCGSSLYGWGVGNVES